MKKLIAVLSLLVLMFPVFAQNATTLEDLFPGYKGKISEQTEELAQTVLRSLDEVKKALAQGYQLTGDEGQNQYGTWVRENLERDYAALFEKSPAFATELYDKAIKPVLQDVKCETQDEEKAKFDRVVAGFNGDDSLICQHILFNLADPFKEIVENEEEAKIKAKKYAAYKVKGMTLPQYIEGVEDILPWGDHEIAQLSKFAADVKRLAK